MLQESLSKELVRANASKNRMVGGRLVRGKVARGGGWASKICLRGGNAALSASETRKREGCRAERRDSDAPRIG